MKTILASPGVLFRFQKTLLPTFSLLFIGAVYILFAEVAYKLNWNETVFILAFIIFASFVVSFAWARIELIKVHLLMERIRSEEKNKETSLKHKLNKLSFKEREVLDQILAGKSNKEICAQLFIEHSTLKSHINRIYKKLDVKSRKEIVLALNFR
ncbi:MAG: helix-turn-helix transcriptional regulator [Algoriphagus sp.]|nr:helix-turn-helix transcriptional regulator [Algoriphagus sp.]